MPSARRIARTRSFRAMRRSSSSGYAVHRSVRKRTHARDSRGRQGAAWPRAGPGNAAMCGSTHRRCRCLFIIDPSRRAAAMHRCLRVGSSGAANPVTAACLCMRAGRSCCTAGSECNPHRFRAWQRRFAGEWRAREARIPWCVGTMNVTRAATWLITTCNGRAGRAPSRRAMAVRRHARLCDAWNAVPAFFGDFGGIRGQSTAPILRKSSICH